MTERVQWASAVDLDNEGIVGACLGCGREVLCYPTGYCPTCMKRYKRRRSAASRRERHGKPRPAVSPTVRRLVYERDGWVCQLCFERVDPAAPEQSDWSATLDHIEEWADGGAEKDPENLRMAHQFCNQARRRAGDDEAVRVLAAARRARDSPRVDNR